MKKKSDKSDGKIKIEIESIQTIHELQYGYPACALIETEIGVTPYACLTESEKTELDKQERIKSVSQTCIDSEQHYDIDGVSMVKDIVIVASAEAS